MRFRDASADDLRQLLLYIDRTDPLPFSVEADLHEWIQNGEHDAAGHMDDYATISRMLDHFTDMARMDTPPLIPMTRP